jgi:hypothetical protein
MNQQKRISGSTEDVIWEQLTKDLSEQDELLEYNVIIQQGDHQVALNIDIDLGGGFESGYETTTLVAPLQTTTDFRFAIHKEDFLDEVGKFFGMQDVVVGYGEFDKNVLVKTNNEARVKELFSEEGIREVFELLTDDFTFALTLHDGKRVLEFSIERGITDPVFLRKIYHAFYTVLSVVEKGDLNVP